MPTNNNSTRKNKLPPGESAGNSQPLPKFLGRYRIDAEIGRGGMGRVYQAYDPELDRVLAIKVLIQILDDMDVQRFLREAKTMAKLRHPNILAVYDIGYDANQPFFTMDLIHGESLQHWIKNDALTIAHMVEIMKKVGNAVAYAHSQGIIHRDLKPANVMLEQDLEPKLLDFGLAKLTQPGSQLSQSGMLLGTLQYMPPEQADGRSRDVDERSDVYGLGTILYEMLAGQPPFTGDSFSQVLNRVMTTPPLPPGKFKANIPQALEAICLKCLEKEKARRYQTAAEFVAELSASSLDPTAHTLNPSRQPGMAKKAGLAKNSSMAKNSSAVRKIGTARKNRAEKSGITVVAGVTIATALILGFGYIMFTSEPRKSANQTVTAATTEKPKPQSDMKKPIKSKPVEPEPVKSKPVEPEPVKSKPVEPEPVKSKPMEPEPIKPKPVESKPIAPMPRPDDQPSVLQPDKPKNPSPQLSQVEEATAAFGRITTSLKNDNFREFIKSFSQEFLKEDVGTEFADDNLPARVKEMRKEVIISSLAQALMSSAAFFPDPATLASDKNSIAITVLQHFAYMVWEDGRWKYDGTALQRACRKKNLKLIHKAEHHQYKGISQLFNKIRGSIEHRSDIQFAECCSSTLKNNKELTTYTMRRLVMIYDQHPAVVKNADLYTTQIPDTVIKICKGRYEIKILLIREKETWKLFGLVGL